MLHVVKHPLITVKLNMMRNEHTQSQLFRELLNEIASLMTYEIFKDLEVVADGKINTPTGCSIDRLKIKNDLVVVPILRAGLGMSDGVVKMSPHCHIGHIGLYRNEETLEPVEYFCKMPRVENPLVILCDPMLATGGSASAAITLLKKRGYNNIRLLCLVGVQEGVDRVLKDHPETEIYICSLDNQLNEKGYILPGLGDAGDRIFGTL